MSEDKIELFRKLCKKYGLRLTHQRLEIFREIERASDHPSVEEVYERVKSRLPTVSLDTVYRTLATFERFGIISRVQGFEDKTRYDRSSIPHHHIICIKCMRIQDFDWPDLDNINLPPEISKWGQTKTKHVLVRGVCERCRRERDRS